MLRIGFLLSHPIQYVSPLLRELSSRSSVEVLALYADRGGAEDQARGGFGVPFEWDIPLLDGYRYRFLKNRAAKPTVSTFSGLDTPEIAEIVAARQLDALIVNGWHFKSAWQAISACWKHGVPALVRSDSHLHSPRSFWKTAAKWPFYRGFIPRLDGCLPVGSWSMEYFLHYGANSRRIHTVPHCIDVERFRSDAERLQPAKGDLRRGWGLPDDRTVFLFAGKFIQKKRPMDYLRALVAAGRAGSGAAGLMVGDGPLRRECERFAAEHRLPVSFAGFLNQRRMPEAYAAADAVVLPSDGGETWGLVVNEGMACGLPAFVSDRVGCGPDLIEPGKTGTVFPLGDVNAIASLMQQYSQPGALGSLGGYCIEKSESFSAGAASTTTIKAVEKVLS